MNQRLETGRLVGGRYRLDALLARGGMAEVWEATDQTLERRVAVKVLHPHLADEGAFRRRFRTEAVAVARLVHPNVVAVYDTCTDDGTDAMVMELVRGRTLRDYLDERGRLEPVEVVHIGTEIASGLSCAHNHGIVHRDVKPANIMLADDGRVLVADFGIAKLLDSADATRTSSLLGTVKYLAPEQLEGGRIDGRTDVYALGSVLYECLCGRPPFERGSPSATALARLVSEAEPASMRAPGVSSTLDVILARSLARVPADRYLTADDLRSALVAAPVGHPFLGEEGPITVSGGPHDAPLHLDLTRSSSTRERPTRTRPTSAIVAVALITAALVVIALLVATTDLGRDLLDRSTSSSAPASGSDEHAAAAVTIEG